MEKPKSLVHNYKIMIKFINYFIILFLILVSTLQVSAEVEDNRIIILVNDEIITNYDIVQRLKIYSIVNQVEITPINNATIANKMIDELIDQILKNEKTKEYNIEITAEELQYYVDLFFENRGQDRDFVYDLMEQSNTNIKHFLLMLESDITWQTLINNLYYRITSISEVELEEMKKNYPDVSLEQAESYILERQLGLQSSKMLRDLRSEATIEYK